MKRASIAVAVLVTLALTGCAAPVDEPASDPQTLSQTATEETPAPLVAETQEPTKAPSSDVAYVKDLRVALEGSGGNSIPDATDEQLIAAGYEACEQMTAGTELKDVRVIDDEPMSPTGYKDSIRIAAVAAQHFCSEHDPGG